MTTSDSGIAAQSPPGAHPGSGCAGDAAVIAALVLGWRLAELYDQDSLPPPSAQRATQPPPPHLPGASESTDYDRAVVLIDQASGAARSLADVLGDLGPTFAEVRATLDRDPHDRADVQSVILDVYNDVRTRLTAAEPRLGTACGLGRLLADTVWLPRSKERDLYSERFDHFRLANAHAWLDDLERALPSRAAAAVRAGLRAWEVRVTALVEADTTDAAFDERVLRALREQGEMWRRLLAGEKDPSSLLSADGYVAAAHGLLRRGRAIAWRFLGAWWFAVLLVLVIAAAGILAALTYAPAGTDRVVAVLVSVAGALGVSWKGLSASLGQTLRRAEAALWLPRLTRQSGEPRRCFRSCLVNVDPRRGSASGSIIALRERRLAHVRTAG